MPVGDMRNPALPQDAQDVLTVLDQYVELVFPGSAVDVPVFRGIPGLPMDGFAVHHDGGMSIFFVDATNADAGDQWTLQLCATLAVDVPDVTGSLLWANDRNRRSAIDRYYCAIAQDGSMCAVAADTSVTSPVLKDFLRPLNHALVGMLQSLAKNTLLSAAEDPKSLLSVRPGRRLTPSEPDLMTLFVIASG